MVCPRCAACAVYSLPRVTVCKQRTSPFPAPSQSRKTVFASLNKKRSVVPGRTVLCRGKGDDSLDDSDESDELERDPDGELSQDEKEKLQQQLQDTRLYAHTESAPIGAEYGQGFVNFTTRGEPVRLDVDALNEKLAVKGRLRLRHAMKPDEQYGVIFWWDDVICDTRSLQRRAWQAVAESRGLPFPEIERPQMYSMRPERVVLDLLHWTRDFGEARAISLDVASEYAARFGELQTATAGLVDWLKALEASRVPCAVVSNIDRPRMTEALHRMGLAGAFQAAVSAEDGMETRSQALLSAAIKLGRPPNQCVAFVADIQGIAAAHNASMKCVAVVGAHPGYSLQTADLACPRLGELTVYNLRRLFANTGSEFMDLTKARSGDRPRKLRPTGGAVMD